MLEILLKHNGVDWLAMVFALLSLNLLGNKNRLGFLTNILGNICWIILNFSLQVYPAVLLNCMALFLNFRGYLKWKQKK